MVKTRSDITIGGVTIKPGSRQSIDLPIPSLYTNATAAMPLHVIHGKQPGPCLVVCAAIHGDELNGVEIIRRLLADKSLNRLKGTLIAVPVVNVFGFISQSRYLPDRRDLNRSFPGSEKGTLAARLANIFMQETVSHATHIIDLHTGAISRENLPQIRAEVTDNPEIEELARAFGTPVIMHSDIRDGSLRGAAQEKDIPVLLYEAGEALRFDEIAIRAGCNGVLRVMCHLGMIRKRLKKPKYDPLISKSSQWVRATQSGILRSIVASGDQVEKGDILAYIGDPLGEEDVEVASPVSGIVIGKANLPLAHEGEAIFHIAKYSEAEEVADHIGIFQDQYDPLTDVVESDEPPLV